MSELDSSQGTPKNKTTATALHEVSLSALQKRFRDIHWPAAIWAGVVSGVMFLIVEMGIGPLVLEQSPWRTMRMMAAIALGPRVLPPPPTFDLPIFLVAMAVHFSLSILYSVIGAIFLQGSPILRAGIYGGVYGLAIYVTNFYGFTILFPWFAEARNWVSVVAHILYGSVSPCVSQALATHALRQHRA